MANVSRGYRCPLWINSGDLQAAAAHFLAAYPNEAVGVINDSGFVALENTSQDPTHTFETPDDSWITHAPIKAVLHSHVNGLAKPSHADMLHQSKTDVPWGIFVTNGEHIGEPLWFGDSLEISPLFERPFVHGIHDCYSLVRDAFRLGKDYLATCPDEQQRIHNWPFPPVTLIDKPREDSWWLHGDDFYSTFFKEAGFVDLEADRHNLSTLQVGDCFFYKLGLTKVVNHAGIYIGGNLILHHVEGYTSHRVPLNLYGYGAERWLRYVGPVSEIV